MNSVIAQQKVVVDGLKKRSSYPHKVLKVKLEETHISWIFLTELYVYKVKKELKFGDVLDFSTLQLRRKFCQKEVVLNKILCDDMYKGVVKIVSKDDNEYQYNNNKSKNNLRIVNLEYKPKAFEYAVKMKQIPQQYRMDNLLKRHKISLRTIKRLSETLVKFHALTPTNTKIKNYGQPKFIKSKVKENFGTLSNLAKKIDPKFEKKLISFIRNNKKLFYHRISEDKVRDIHGDLYLKNIFVVQNKFYLYDRIEFNDSLRYADVVEDVAHLSMDLDHNKRINLRRYFVSQYIEKSNDVNLEELIYFWMCYKACVRAKVSLFHAKNEPAADKRESYVEESNNLLVLADCYLEFL
jgi:aminoglycoside phosphotransferase family enzyme